MKSKTSKVSLITFIGMTVALAASIRNIPDVAGSGWTMFFYMGVASLLFALPICLIAGEFGSAFPEKGGPELWVSNSLGGSYGFALLGYCGFKCSQGWLWLPQLCHRF